MSPLTTSAFDLPSRLSAKADPHLIAADERHFAAIAASLDESIADLTERLDAVRKNPGGIGRRALERDEEVRRVSSRLRTLRRFGLDLCLGSFRSLSGTFYVGRLGMTDGQGRRLLLDWRSPAAEPFFGATHGNPMGLTSRRRYRWTNGRVTDYWDEVFNADEFEGHKAALDDQSAFIASLGTNRSAKMRDVLGTIQADQDAIIRAGSAGALVVDGGPGTGKTVVALHRAAYLLYSDPRLAHRQGGVLFVGPHEPYLAYVADVLPSLGEEGVQSCTLRDLVAEGATAGVEADPSIAALKSSAGLVTAIEAAVRFYEEPPSTGLSVGDLWLSPSDWAEAFAVPGPGTPHNEARDEVWDELLTILMAKSSLDASSLDSSSLDSSSLDASSLDSSYLDSSSLGPSSLGPSSPDSSSLVRRSLVSDRGLRNAFNRAWPLLSPTDIVGDLWSVPAYLRKCAPWLAPSDVRALQRDQPQAWTVSDLPLLDAARRRLGDPSASRHRRQEETTMATERTRMSRVLDDLLAANEFDDGEGVWTMLRGQDMRTSLEDDTVLARAEPDRLAGPFAHVVVDEAQELTDAEWQMLIQRCPARSFTIVGDRAQARHGFPESWESRLTRIGLPHVRMASLTINYRTPQEVMNEAAPEIRSALPDANVPTSIRQDGHPVTHGPRAALPAVLHDWLTTHTEGIACVIGDPSFPSTDRVRSLTPSLAKGLEFDLVVLIDPASFGTGIEGAVDRYVAMTRATQQLVILT